MVFTKFGNIFDFDADAIIMTTNCFGKFGKYGIEKKFKTKRPMSYQNYLDCCANSKNSRKLMGKISMLREKSVWSFMIFSQYRYEANDHRHFDYKAFESGLKTTKTIMKNLGLTTAIIPFNAGCDPSGCANEKSIEKVIYKVFQEEQKLHILFVKPSRLDFMGVNLDEGRAQPQKAVRRAVKAKNVLVNKPVTGPVREAFFDLEQAARDIMRDRMEEPQ